jgi:adenylyl-sulfate kinase
VVNAVRQLPAAQQPPSQPSAARCIWLTGLSGAGKSSVAQVLASQLAAQDLRYCLLDGDALRRGLNSDLGFSPADRAQSVRRTAHVARLMVDAGVTAVVALISPYRVDRAAARALFAPGEFVEVFVDTPLAVCEQRDTKGLYAKARGQHITDMTGIGSDYEAPLNPEVRLACGEQPLHVCAEQLAAYLALAT